jgi:hypothetical protein
MWYIYAMEYYLAIKKNETMSFTGKWMELEIIIIKQDKPSSERQILHVFASGLHMQPNMHVKSRPKKVIIIRCDCKRDYWE